MKNLNHSSNVGRERGRGAEWVYKAKYQILWSAEANSWLGFEVVAMASK